jgi:hypothetical protein
MRNSIVLMCGLLVVAEATAADVRVRVTDLSESPIKQVLAESVLDTSADALFAAISDVERYAAFVPYMVESRIVARDSDSIVNYQRLSFGIPFVASRHYAIRIRFAKGTDGDGRAIYQVTWTLAPEAALPADVGAVAVPLNVGFWHLEELGTQPPTTHVLYCVVTDPGGQLPVWIVNRANVETIPQLFDAMRIQAQSERYAHASDATVRMPTSTLHAPASCGPNA